MQAIKAIKVVLALLWLWLLPIHQAILTALSLAIADLVLALLCAAKQHTPIRSAGLKRTVAKILMYEAAIVLAFLAETYLLGPFVPAVKMVTGLIGMTELKSCLEHLDDLGGNPLFASILTRLAPPQPPADPDDEV